MNSASQIPFVLMIPLEEIFYLCVDDESESYELACPAPHAIVLPIDMLHSGSMQRQGDLITAPLAANRRLHVQCTDGFFNTQATHVYKKHELESDHKAFAELYMRGGLAVKREAAQSVAAIRKALELDANPADDRRRVDGVTRENALIGQSFDPGMIFDILSPLQGHLGNAKPRPVWMFTSGMGSELPALKRLGVRLSAIYCIEIHHDAVEVVHMRANTHYPGVPVITTGDLRSESARGFWSASSIWRRLDQEGVPIIISGWPCDGDSPQNATAQHAEGLSHPATALLNEIGRVYSTVVRWNGTPRLESMPVYANKIRLSVRP